MALGAPVGDIDGRKLTPMLCERSEGGPRVLGRQGWTYELKLDGVRIVADKRGDAVALTYRRSRDATASYPEIADAIRALPFERVVLDGEIVAFDAEGRPDFERLGTRIQVATKDARKAAVQVPVAYVVFDVLAVGDRDVRGLPLEARKAILERVLAGERSSLLRIAPTFDSGVELFALCREKRLEGVVAKRHGSSYRVGERTTDWLKIKCELEADFVIVGWAEGEGRRAQLGALDLAAWEDGKFVIRGAVGSGLDEDTIERLLDVLRPLVVDKPMATGKWNAKKSRFYVRPEIVVSVQYMSFSTDGSLKHPVFRGIRPDLAPEDCTIKVGDEEGRPVERRRIHLTNPDRPVAADGTTKVALCKYYESIAPVILPLLEGRPCMFVEGPAERPIWPLPKHAPAWVRTIAVPGLGKREARGVMIDDVDTLIFGVESGATSLLAMPHHEDARDTADFVTLRSSAKGAAAVVAQAAAVHLPGCVRAAGQGKVEALVGLGRAPIAVADAIGPLLAKLASDASGEAVDVAPMAIAPCATLLDAAGAVKVSISGEPGPVAFDAAPAVTDDVLAAVLATRVDLDAAVAAIERALRGV